MLEILQFAIQPSFPLFPTCSLCNEPIELETARTDDYGKAVHEECYEFKIGKRRRHHKKTRYGTVCHRHLPRGASGLN